MTEPYIFDLPRDIIGLNLRGSGLCLGEDPVWYGEDIVWVQLPNGVTVDLGNYWREEEPLSFRVDVVRQQDEEHWGQYQLDEARTKDPLEAARLVEQMVRKWRDYYTAGDQVSIDLLPDPEHPLAGYFWGHLAVIESLSGATCVLADHVYGKEWPDFPVKYLRLFRSAYRMAQDRKQYMKTVA